MSRPHQDDLDWFSEQMFVKLLENSHKPGWDEATLDLDYAIKRLRQEVDELDESLYDLEHFPNRLDSLRVEVIAEAADVANFAFMVAYKARSLQTSA